MASEAAREQQRPAPTLLHVHVTLKGRTVKTYTFAHDEILVGRDPDADIFLDNVGVSREHAKFERTPSGYVVEDLGSANGTFLNDKPVQRNLLNDDDVVQIGKYSLRIVEREDRRADETHPGGPAPDAMQQTTVLSRDQVAKVLTASRTEETKVKRSQAKSHAQRSVWRQGQIRGAIAGAFLLGVVVGALAVFLLGS